jgi:galactose mutarotase-like enzyme
MISVARRNPAGQWTGFLHRDNDLTPPARGWANHATVMGYYLHRLKDGHTQYRGRELRGGTHGFLRHANSRLISAADAAVHYQIAPDDFSPDDYPLKVGVTLTYKIDNDAVVVEFAFRNHEPELSAHVSFGLHPGFAASTFESFRLEMPPGVYRRWFAPDNYLSGETQEFFFAGGLMPFDRAKLPGSYIIQFVDVPERKFRLIDVPSAREVIVDLAGVPYCTLWSDGGPFVCVEPCWGLTDRDNQRPFEDKDGMQIISAGGELRAGFRMQFSADIDKKSAVD